MKTFLQRFGASIYGVLSGFDRIRFRGTQRLLASVAGLSSYLAYRGVLLKEFKPYVTAVTETLRHQVEMGAEAAGIEVQYVNDSSVSKEDLAAEMAKQVGRTQGELFSEVVF
jgi:hypothetical protein